MAETNRDELARRQLDEEYASTLGNSAKNADDLNERRLIEDAISNVREAIAPTPAKHEEQIGRYRIDRVLGKGKFGLVYLGFDEQLDRLVAIKVPHAKYVDNAADAQAFLAEARVVAGLDHSNIVPVYDVGSTDRIPCFIVSRYVNGMDLAEKIKKHKHSVEESAELVSILARALHYAHTRGLVHRDVKPRNILLDANSKPFLADFGLALRDQDIVSDLGYAGTPIYMSPEQARGEGHRVDGRSDIFSLGVVLYELLTGRRPFAADSLPELLKRIISFEPKPLRQIDDTIPRELEAICLKVLEKKVGSRYTTALDLAEALDDWRSTNVSPQPARTDWPLLQVVGSPYAYQPPALADRCTVGRQRRREAESQDIGSDFVIRVQEDEQQTLKISRRHFVLTREANGFCITDCSKAGTCLNGERLERLVPKPIRAGDIVLVANVVRLQVVICTVDKREIRFPIVPLNVADHRIVLETSLGDLTTVEPDES